jgi:hypothetical protein
MQSVKRILVLFTGLSLIVAGLLGVVVVFDFMSLTDMRELLVRLVSVLGIVSGVSLGLLLLGHINHQP